MPLPPGLILNPGTGEITGTPTTPGTYQVKLRVRDALGNAREHTDDITINSYTAMSWTGDLGPLMATRAMPANTLAHAGGLAPIAFTVLSGALPSGLSLNPTTGVVTGTPDTAGEYAVTIRATDALSQTEDAVLAGTVLVNLTATENVDGGRCTLGVAKTVAAPIVAGGEAPFAYTLQAGTLPPGLALNASTGVISGTPTGAAADYSGIVLRVTGANGFTDDTGAFTLSVKPAPTLSGVMGRGTVGSAYSATYTGSLGFTPYAFSAQNLPPGLAINASTGAVTGAPNFAANFLPVITLTDAAGNIATRSNAVEIALAVSLSGTPPEATRLTAYSFRPAIEGGWPPYSYAIITGALPTGLTLDADDGTISGTPTVQSSFTATLEATDADGNTDTLPVNIDVAGDLVISGSLTAQGTVGSAYSDDLNATGGVGTLVWSVSAGALPPGVNLNTSTGTVSGTPTTPGSYSFSIKVTDANGSNTHEDYAISVAAALSLSGSGPDMTNGRAYSYSYSRGGGHAPYGYTIVAGALPTGLSLNASTGVISGTPTVNGAASYTVRVTDDAGATDDVADSVTVYAPVALSGSYLTRGELTKAYSDGISVTGGKAPIDWTKAGGTLPPGMSLNNSSGVLSGTPTGTGVYEFTVRATDALGDSDDISGSIEVRSRVSFNSGYRHRATRGRAYNNIAVDVTGGWTPRTFAKVGGTLPPGLALSTITGNLSGTPSTSGSYDFTIRVTDDLGVTSDLTKNITVRDPVTITGDYDARATVGVGVSDAISISGGWGPFSWARVAGALPGGTTLNSSTGTLSGTPNAAGTFNFTVRVTDTDPGGGSSDDRADSIVVANGPSLTATYPRATVGESYSGSSVSATGGHAPYTFTRIYGSFPAGLTANSEQELSGTPTTAATYNFGIRVTDDVGNISETPESITVATALSLTGNYPNGTDNQAYSSTLAYGGGWTPRSFSLLSGTLPPGLSLASAEPTVSGTPTTPGSYNFTVRMTDGDGHVQDSAQNIEIVADTPALAVTCSPNPSNDSAVSFGGVVTTQAESTASASGGSGGYTYSWAFISATGDAGAFSHGSTTSATFGVTKSGSTPFQRTEVWRCTARDSASSTATKDVSFTLTIDR